MLLLMSETNASPVARSGTLTPSRRLPSENSTSETSFLRSRPASAFLVVGNE